MRIGLNLLHALPEIGGGWNYIANLVAALGKYDGDNNYVAFVTKESKRLVPSKPNFMSVCVNIRPASRVQRVVYENTWLQLLSDRYKLDCMHWFANTQALANAVPGVVTVYDMHSFLNFATFSLAKRFYSQIMMYQTSRRARILLPMSQATAQDLCRVLHANPARMIVIPPVLNPQFKPASCDEVTSFRAEYRLPGRFWLYVAHILPYKNHLLLLQAYHGVKSGGFTPWPLVLRGDPKGAESEVVRMVAQLGLESDVIMLPRLDEAELPALYSAASALVFPSLYEGGGMPVVEAMACGCPVIASNIPSVREYAGDAACYFNPRDLRSIGEAMLEFQSDTGPRERSRRAGLVRAEEFRPQQVIGKLVSAYHKALTR